LLDNPLGETGIGVAGGGTAREECSALGDLTQGNSHMERYLGCNFTGRTGTVRGPIERGTFSSAWPDACSFERRGTILSSLIPCILTKETLRARLHVLSK
jgi:hypothetical protein